MKSQTQCHLRVQLPVPTFQLLTTQRILGISSTGEIGIRNRTPHWVLSSMSPPKVTMLFTALTFVSLAVPDLTSCALPIKHMHVLFTLATLS